MIAERVDKIEVSDWIESNFRKKGWTHIIRPGWRKNMVVKSKEKFQLEPNDVAELMRHKVFIEGFMRGLGQPWLDKASDELERLEVKLKECYLTSKKEAKKVA